MADQATPITTDQSSFQAAAPVLVVNASLNAKGEPTFNLPLDVENIRATEVVDLDFLLITQDGQRFLLPQGALQAASNPNAAISFKNGFSISAAEQLKKTGISKPVEGGSYRINSSDLTPNKVSIPPNAGDDFLQGNENKELSADVQSALEQLEKVTQSLQNASLSQSALNSNEVAELGPGLGSGKGPGTGFSNNNYITATAGSPPVIKYTSNNTSDNPSVNPNISQRQLNGDVQAKVSNVAQWDGTKLTGIAFGDTSINAMMVASPLKVIATGDNVMPQWTAGMVKADLVLPGVTNAAKVTLTLDPNFNSSLLPPEFKINGVALTNQSLTFIVKGTDVSRLHLSWSMTADANPVIAQTFAVGVKFIDAAGKELQEGNAPLTFKYADFRAASDATGLDNQSNPHLNLSAFGMSYDITGRAQDDVIHGGDGHDIVRGMAGNDVLQGGAGDDMLIGGAGADQMDGGTGKNTANYAESSQGVTVFLDLANQHLNAGGDAQGDSLVNIQNLMGSDHDDTLVSDVKSNILNGGAGNDLLIGNGGHDQYIGGDGSDTVSYQNDTIGVLASLANPSLNTGQAAGDAYTSIENLRGGSGNDTLIGDANKNDLFGGLGRDTFIGGAGADYFDGGDGSDTVSYAGSLIAITASLADPKQNSGADAVGDTYQSIENLTGSDNEDTLIGNDQANMLIGGASNDTFEGGLGADVLNGGDGIDVASYQHATTGVFASLINPSQNDGPTARGDTFISIENLTGSNFADTLMGDSHNNVLIGLDGNDTFMGYGGGDTFDGGAGIDTVSYAWLTSGVGIQASLDVFLQSVNSGGAAGDTYIRIEKLIGTSYADSLIGDANQSGNTLDGGAGNDLLIDGGGSSPDAYMGGTGIDTVSYQNATAAVGLTLSGGGSSGDAAGDVYTSIEQVIATSYDDYIEGDSGDNVLYGQAGNDTLFGGSGNDNLYGGAGDDLLKATTGSGTHQYYGGDASAGSGTDTVSYEGFNTKISANLTAVDGNANGAGSIERFFDISNLTGGNNDDSLTGNNAANTLTGGGGHDALFGLDGNDGLFGGAGDDTLDGGAGADILNGGAGFDTATYANSSQGLVIDLVTGVGRGTGDAVGDTYIEIERLLGTRYDDTFYAGNSAMNFDGGFGGTDTVSYVSANVGVNASLIRDTNYNSPSDASVQGTWASGQTFSNIENLTGSARDDVLAGNAQVNRLMGGAGNDLLMGSMGGTGDTFIGDDLSGTGVGINTVSYDGITSAPITASLLTHEVRFAASSQVDTLNGIQNLTGGSGHDYLTGDSDVNVLTGGAGNDTLEGGLGDDQLFGGAGNDTASYANALSPVIASLLNPSVNTGEAAGDTYKSIENLLGSGLNDSLSGDTNANTLIGGVGNDTLDGGSGNDILQGGDGNDILLASSGADLFDGGAGFDTVSYSSYEISADLTTVKIDLTNQTLGQGLGDGGVFVAGTIEQVVGGSANDTFVLSANASTFIDGGSGVNTLSYENSTVAVVASLKALSSSTDPWLSNASLYTNIQNLTGGSGNDTLEGNDSSNIIDGGAGIDTVSYASTSANVTVNLLTNIASVAVGNTDTLISIENITGGAGGDSLTGDESANTLIGGDGNDRLFGGGGRDLLMGGDGNDILDGGLGDDTLIGGAGADTFYGDGGTDTVSYEQTTLPAMTIDLSNPSNGTGDAQGDIFNADISIVQGSNGNDTFYGRSTTETLIGGRGDDNVFGSMGADKLDGDIGNDTINYSQSSAVILDFSSIQDTNGYISVAVTNVTTNLSAGDQLKGFETVIGSSGNDVITANNLGMRLEGGGGNDILTGGVGNDTLISGVGADTLFGGSGNDTLDLNTNNTNLAGDSASGGVGNDTISINQLSLINAAANVFTIDGGVGNDALQFYASSNATLNLGSTFLDSKFNSIETLDLSLDGKSSNVVLSSAGVIGLVDAGNNAVLTLKLSPGADTYSIAAGETATFGNNSVSLTNTTTNTSATVNFVYA